MYPRKHPISLQSRRIKDPLDEIMEARPWEPEPSLPVPAIPVEFKAVELPVVSRLWRVKIWFYSLWARLILWLRGE